MTTGSASGTARTLDARIAAAQAQVDAHANALTATLQQLVRIASVWDPAVPDGNELAAAQLVAQLLDDWGMAYRWREVAPQRPNIVVDLVGSRPGTILVMEGHTDVVTAGDRAAWTVDPFGGEIRDGVLWGRGTCDMKGGLVAMLFAARALQLTGCDFAGTLRLAVLADEEGLMLGAKAFVDGGELAGVSAAIICEPEGDRVCVAQKGALRYRFTFHGRMAHGCMPDEGANPVAALAEAAVALRALEREVLAEQPRHPLLGRFSLTPTVALGGEREQANVIAARAELLLDVRTTPQHDHARITERIRAAVERATATIAGVSCELTLLDDRPATDTNPADPLVRAALAAHAAETGTQPALGGVPGSTDGTIFWAATRVPLVTWGPGATTLPHQADEHVRLDEVVRYARMYAGAALRYFDEMERR